MEITRRHLETVLSGRVLESLSLTHERTARHNASPDEVVTRLQGRRVMEVGRRGKFLQVRLDDGQTMVTHLGMSGRWAIDADETIPHTHFVARLDDGTTVSFIDPRTFGFVAVYDDDDLAGSGLARVGPDAWADPPDVDQLAQSLRRRTAPIKALLLDQTPIAGLGNIYADEVLFRAGIHPLTPGGSLDAEQLRRILVSVHEVLTEAISNGGTTLDDLAYLLPDGSAGQNVMGLDVYGREGEPCPRCGSPISRVVIRSRSAHFCPKCQAEP